MKKVSSELNFDKFAGPERKFHVEFHWKMGSLSDCLGISLDDLSSQVVSGTMDDHSFKVFTPSANLLLAIMHHGGKDQLIKLKYAADFGHVMKRYNDLDWRWIIKEAKRFNIEKTVYVSIKLASVLTGVPVPETIRDQVET